MSQISILSTSGELLDHFRVKARPLSVKVSPVHLLRCFQLSFAFGAHLRAMTVTPPSRNHARQFGGRSSDNECIVSVNMDGKTILLYNLNHHYNALELAFQPRYGVIVSYEWFGDGHIMVGFSNGYLIEISTRASPPPSSPQTPSGRRVYSY